jgi:hypothetical protein
MKLNDRALLVTLKISQWAGRKHDKQVTKQVASQHAADTSVGRFNKSLLPATGYLEDVHAMTSAIRQMVYQNTMAWGSVDGTRLLPVGNYLAFTATFRRMLTEREAAVERFLSAYPRLKEEAKLFLPNGLYKEDDYPDVDTLRGKFACSVEMGPVPTDDFRVQLGDAELAQIKADVVARTEASMRDAMREVWQRLYDRVKHMADKLQAIDDTADVEGRGKARLHESTIENIREICELLPRLNITNDPDLEAMRQRVADSLGTVETDALKADPLFRERTKTEAQSIMDAMATFMGGV